MRIMHNLLPHVYGAREPREGLFDDLNRPVDAGTETSGFDEEDFTQWH